MTAVEAARALIADIPDPEIPVLTLEDLGILRGVHEEDGRLVVSLTPTYTGCPATEAIREQVERTLEQAGHLGAQVRLTLSPPWTTDWISARGRRRLTEYGIAPPACAAGPLPGEGERLGSGQVIRIIPRPVHASKEDPVVACPRCASADTEQLSAHSSTPCKALYRCRACREPFDYFKPY
ncbi:MAG: 1,2-phenylacetyl-CoA epoxidase subunit PaaD [Burkholderiaceae bacterium]